MNPSPRRLRVRALTLAPTAALLALALTSPASGSEARQGQPQGGVAFYSQHAKRGTLKRLHGDRYALTLRGVHSRLAAFSGQGGKLRRLKTNRFAGSWGRLGFAEQRPRAILLLFNRKPGRAQLRLRLGEPRYLPRTKTIRYPARLTGGEAVQRFRRARLLIDAHTGLPGGCVIEPYAQCAGADLHGRDLFGAYLVAADLSGADLTGANLRGADLVVANLRRADFSGANLTGANLRAADLTGTKFCQTTMPNGGVNYRDC